MGTVKGCHHHSSCSIPEVPQPGVLVVSRLLSVRLGGVAMGGGEEAGHQLAETVHPEHGETITNNEEEFDFALEG